MEKYIIDRFEGDFAVLEKEGGGTFDVKKELLEGACEGDVVIYENGKYIIDVQETQMRRKNIEEKMRRLFDKA